MNVNHHPFQIMAARQICYSVDLLTPTRPVPSEWVQKFKSLRLECLRSNPTAYITTFASADALTDDQWSEQLLHPKYHHLICHRPQVSTEGTAPNENVATEGWEGNDEWVGMFWLLGPHRKDEYAATPFVDSTALGSDQEETRWHLTGLYLQPDSRCEASAIAIHEAMLNFLRFWTDDHLESTFDHATGLEKPKRARVTGHLRGGNDPLVDLYEGLAGTRTLAWVSDAVGRRIGGFEDRPEDEKIDKARGRVMERIVDC